ncbi:MAG: Ubiquinone biosynthesis accessory factor UbiJ [Catillopecten margaritatus gill symbiont]|uniref:Ubiquinone biosynthesis accessory factor UbiJ n=1 Tax=Catillopecten margaritatus gill symbiont TaxID=3083288 RepID=A0AAU6PHE9_9GAMM
MQAVILERALNFLLETHPINIQPLDGKTVHFSLQDFPLEVNFICTNNRIFVTTDTSTKADVDVKLQANVFLALFQGEDLTELLRQDKIVIHGDVKTAQLLVDLLQQVEIDLEELLSKYTGDIVAHQVGKLAKKFKSSDNPLASIKNDITNLLIRPEIK